MNTIWKRKHKNVTEVAELADNLELPLPVASVLYAKGITTTEQAQDFFNLSLKKLHHPLLLPDIKRVVDRITLAIKTQEKIFVWGDYDVDGITATAVVVTSLKLFNAVFDFKVPHRIDDGYDLKPASIDEAIAAKAQLMMSVDCGILAFEAAEYAARQNIDLIITDHHTPSDNGAVPNCIGVVNPNRLDSEYPFKGLAGVGIAFKVMMAVGKSLDYSLPTLMKELLEYVALGTVADVAPMIDENRILVHAGCKLLSTSKKPGIKELLKIAGVSNVTPLSIGFQLGPRINAIGRLGDSMIALELMLERNESRAKFLALQLDTANKRRQTKQENTVQEAIDLVELMPEDEHPFIIVVGARTWHPGLVGLVAGKLVEKFNKPALVCAINEYGKAKGSCRSTRHFHILNALKSDAAINYFNKKSNGTPIMGGHAYAAGFETTETNLPLLRKALNEYAANVIDDSEKNCKIIEIDAKIRPSEINAKIYDKLSILSPFGAENEIPVFQCDQLTIKNIKQMSDGKHLKLIMSHPLCFMPIEGIGWRQGHRAQEIQEGDVIDIVLQLTLEEYLGKTRCFANILDFRKK